MSVSLLPGQHKLTASRTRALDRILASRDLPECYRQGAGQSLGPGGPSGLRWAVLRFLRGFVQLECGQGRPPEPPVGSRGKGPVVCFWRDIE